MSGPTVWRTAFDKNQMGMQSGRQVDDFQAATVHSRVDREVLLNWLTSDRGRSQHQALWNKDGNADKSPIFWWWNNWEFILDRWWAVYFARETRCLCFCFLPIFSPPFCFASLTTLFLHSGSRTEGFIFLCLTGAEEFEKFVQELLKALTSWPTVRPCSLPCSRLALHAWQEAWNREKIWGAGEN